MNGWTIPTTVFLVAAAILCAALLTIHYARAAALVVAAEVALATAGAWIAWRWISTPTADRYQVELQRRARQEWRAW